VRAGRTHGVRRLDELKEVIGYRPIKTQAMLTAAKAVGQGKERRPAHRPRDPALDADVILAAQRPERSSRPNVALP
jgi:hypothetical protein